MLPTKRKLEKWPFLDQNDGLTPIYGKNVNFSTFWTSCFYSLERRFLVLKHRKRHFPGLYSLKKKIEKMAIFRPKALLNPFGKMSIFFTFWTSWFYRLERRFLVLEYRNRHDPVLYCLKKNVGKISIFAPKPWVNPL